MQELAYNNEPVNLSLLGNWSMEGRPSTIFLPYSQLALKWDSKSYKWEYKNYSQNSLSLCCSSLHNSFTDSKYSIPSLLDPIGQFEQEDLELE